jgi:plastocyanin
MLKQMLAALSVFVVLNAAFAAPAPYGKVSARASSKDKPVTLDGVRYRDHGTEDVRGKSKLTLKVDNYYFAPTFLTGNPGQKLTVVVENGSGTLHNLYIAALDIDKDIPPSGKLEVQFTFPASGVVPFVCKYHSATGMNGRLQSP